jgi:glutamyl-tRNA synthetase
MTVRTSRFAPSPTGALHLGNARTFALNWALAQQHGWTMLLRIEDLDHPRVKPETINQAREDLAWLGLTWDTETPVQSTDIGPCCDAFRKLAAAGRIFPCDRSRKEVQAAQSAPHDNHDGMRYEPMLRPQDAGRQWDEPDENQTWRFLVDDAEHAVNDQISGPHSFNLGATIGDFPIWTTNGPAYQLAVVVDDARQGVSDVVRGNDLLSSAARQQTIAAALDLTPPRWWHVPLVRGEDGRRLAKRHGDTRISSYRAAGVPAERVIGLLASWCGVKDLGEPNPMDADEFAATVDISSIPTADAVLTARDIQWLTNC